MCAVYSTGYGNSCHEAVRNKTPCTEYFPGAHTMYGGLCLVIMVNNQQESVSRASERGQRQYIADILCAAVPTYLLQYPGRGESNATLAGLAPLSGDA